jgi:hypothetical protein
MRRTPEDVRVALVVGGAQPLDEARRLRQESVDELDDEVGPRRVLELVVGGAIDRRFGHLIVPGVPARC